MKKTISICSYNTRTINNINEDNRDIMGQELSSVKWDVVRLSETKIKETEIFTHKSGHHFYRYTSGNGSNHSSRVGFLVNKSIIDTVK